MTQAATTLNALVQTARDGLDFYTEAAARVRNPQLKILFRALIDAKHQLISALSEEVRVRGEAPSREHTLAGNLRQLYAGLRAHLGDGGDYRYVAELERAEDRLLAAFEQAARHADDAALRRVIEAHLPRVRRCHEQMRNLKLALAA